jgi:hypothetical protein
VARHATGKRSKGELLSSMYNGNAAGVKAGHLQGRGGLHRQAIIEDDVCGREIHDLLLQERDKVL